MAAASTVVSLLAFGCVTVARSCGIITHIEVGHRSLDHFGGFPAQVNYQKLLLKHIDAFQAGAPYPDTFYPSACQNGIYHNVSEDSHWSPFLNATINYIRRKYPLPWSEEAEKLVAFMFGFTSHQVADILWHSIGFQQGFLRTMGYVNFHGSYDKAHRLGDIGSDVLNTFEQNLAYVHSMPEYTWYIPVDDLFNIYNEYYGRDKIPKKVILSCSVIMYLERTVDLLAASELFPEYSSKSPFLVDQLSDYFLGGLDDMAGWTQVIWKDVIHMMEHGTSACDVPRNTLFINCNNTLTRKHQLVGEKFIETNGYFVEPKLGSLSFKDVKVRKTRRGAYIQAAPDLRAKLEDKLQMRKRQHPAGSTTKKPVAVYTVDSPYSKLGWTMTTGDCNHDDLVDLLISAPGYGQDSSPQQGRVYQLHANITGLPPGDVNLDSIAGHLTGTPEEQSRFGSSVAVVDINLDGVNDLVVGAPSSGMLPSLRYEGIVLIYFGRADGQEFQGINVSIQCHNHQYCSLGWNLAVGDLNGDGHKDLVMGSPFFSGKGAQRGFVGALFSSEQYHDSQVVQIEQLDWVLYGDQDYGWLGYSMKVTRYREKDEFLLIGQPTYRLCQLPNCSFSEEDVQSAGRIHIYSLGAEEPSFITALTGTENFGQFGMSMDVGRPYGGNITVLAVSAPTQSVNGTIADLPVMFSQTGTVSLITLGSPQPALIASFAGHTQFGRFGEIVMFADMNLDGVDDLIISAPLRTKLVTPGRATGHHAAVKNTSNGLKSLYSPEEGRVFIYYGGLKFPKGNVTSHCSTSLIQPCPGEKSSVELFRGEEGARFGSSLAVLPQKEKVYLAVASSHSSAGSRLSGSVSVFAFP